VSTKIYNICLAKIKKGWLHNICPYLICIKSDANCTKGAKPYEARREKKKEKIQKGRRIEKQKKEHRHY
jgi:hypothetical protein